MIDTATDFTLVADPFIPGNCDAELPRQEYPAQRLMMDASAEALADSELLSLVFGNKSPAQSLGMARRLLAAHGSLRALAQAPLAEILQVPGVGPSAACAIIAALQMGRRLNKGMNEDRQHLGSALEISDYMQPLLRDKLQEEMHVLMVDSRHHLLRDVTCTVGLADRAQCHSREIFREAIRANCTRIFLVHNHPGGDPAPSPQDVECTRGLVAAGKIIGIDMLDHIIIGTRTPAHPQPFCSLLAAGLM